MALSIRRSARGPSRPKSASAGRAARIRPTWVVAAAAAAVLGIAIAVGWFATADQRRATVDGEAPEAKRVLAVQAKMPFQIMIPAYLPPDLDRANVQIEVEKAGPAGEPMVCLTYGTKDPDGPKLFVQEWVPGNPQLETLAASRPIRTKWGKGWLLTHEQLTAIWADVGPTRASVYTTDVGRYSREQILAMAESLGPPSNTQVFNFLLNGPAVKDMPAPEPFKVPVGKNGVQEVTLVITPGGYDPIRFAVKKDIPVVLRFRQLGQVGCGDTLIFPSDPKSLSSLKLKSAGDEKVLKFTPKQAGEFEFYCGHRMYRGILTVKG